MLRAGLTGGLGSGKTTAAQIFAKLGAHVFSADELGRALMQPGEHVYHRIAGAFGPRVVRPDGQLDRPMLAQMAFGEGKLRQLNEIVHPAVIAEQERQMRLLEEIEPEAVAIVESALIFEVERDGTGPGWSRRFDRLILVTASDEVKIARYLARLEQLAGKPLTSEQGALAIADARRRMSYQIPDAEKAALCDYVIENHGPPELLEQRAAEVYKELAAQS